MLALDSYPSLMPLAMIAFGILLSIFNAFGR
jgi:hypothetical protein